MILYSGESQSSPVCAALLAYALSGFVRRSLVTLIVRVVVVWVVVDSIIIGAFYCGPLVPEF